MYKFVLTVIVGVCVFAGSALASIGSIGRTQSFQIGAMNQVDWAGGIGSARGENVGNFSQAQQASDYRSGTSVAQTARGTLTQSATASGTGLGSARQDGNVNGSQDMLAQTGHQLAGRGQQDLTVKLDMRLFKPNGIGAVNGTQSYTGSQEQRFATPYGTSSQSQSVDVRTSGSISTQVNIDPLVRNSISINMRQSQTNIGPQQYHQHH